MSKGKIAIVGFGETPFSRGKEESGEQRLSSVEYISWAAELALKSVGLSKKDLDNRGLAVTRTMSSPVFWGGEIAETLGITPKMIINVDHGGASAAAMILQAGFAMQSGVADFFLCVAGEAPMSQAAAQISSSDTEGYRRDFEKPFGFMGPNSMFAMILRRHQMQFGTTQEQTGKIALIQREHANLNPNAYFHRQKITLKDYLQSRFVAEPLRLLDCVMPVDGGLAFVVTREELAHKYSDRPVYVLGFGECDNYYHGNRGRPDVTHLGIQVAAREALRMASLAPKDMQFFQPYDDYTIAVLMQLEDAGFCKKGEGGKFVEKTDISYRGQIPLNTGGGQLSCGQPGLAGGSVNIAEAVRQLRGEGGLRQVRGAKIGMTTGIGKLQYARNTAYNIAIVLGAERPAI